MVEFVMIIFWYEIFTVFYKDHNTLAVYIITLLRYTMHALKQINIESLVFIREYFV